MIPPSWRICDECGRKDDVERVDGGWLCFGCRVDPQRCPKTTPACSSNAMRESAITTYPRGFGGTAAPAQIPATDKITKGTCSMVPSLVRFALLILSIAFSACTLEPEEPTAPAPAPATSPPAFYPGEQCVLLPEKLTAPAGACFLITADEWSTLATCDGTFSDNETGKTWELECPGCGPAYPTSSFEIPGGGCFQFYNCHPSGVAAPIVEPCP